MANNTQQVKIPSLDKIYELRQSLSRGWFEVAGILKSKKKINPLRYQKQIRKEWDKQLQKFSRVSHL